MECPKEISSIQYNKSFLGKKIKNTKKFLKNENSSKVEEINTNSNTNSFFFESSTELSNDNFISLDEKIESIKIPGLDDINIPSFLNDIENKNEINRKIKNYYKLKKELGSNELAKIYLIDVNRLYKHKKKF